MPPSRGAHRPRPPAHPRRPPGGRGPPRPGHGPPKPSAHHHVRDPRPRGRDLGPLLPRRLGGAPDGLVFPSARGCFPAAPTTGATPWSPRRRQPRGHGVPTVGGPGPSTPYAMPSPPGRSPKDPTRIGEVGRRRGGLKSRCALPSPCRPPPYGLVQRAASPSRALATSLAPRYPGARRSRRP